ncbi:GAF domain-containing sensor histidine kinase [Pedobacter cryophilus]|uniref:histidine kinase n=1 Tax=Pedobacter cryophilus TaxID=2571271 RepID=A0A4U1BX02_9SPHI|nr:GAF domain-containing sensor histidine kinase [Pedobacter cryophilus]TKB97052.1 GAF domain-containing protein [Pedobacter cryophilus]
MTTDHIEDKKRMDKIFKITSILSKSEENTLSEILKISCSLLGMQLGMIGKIEKDDYFFYEFYSAIAGDDLKGVTLNIKDTFCDLAVTQNEVIFIDDAGLTEYKSHPCFNTFKIRSYIGVPIKFNEQENGTLSFSSYDAKTPGFTQADSDFVQYLGQWVNNYFDKLFYEENITKKNKEFAINNENLQKIMQEKNQLTQILVHDLKSPLSNIQMLSFLFQDFVKDKESEELLNIFNKSLQDVFHLIDQMETLNSVENVSLNYYIEEFDLNLFLVETLKNFQNTADFKQINLEYTFNAAITNVKTDQNFLKRILHNLISNAIKFSPFQKNIYVNLSLKDEEYLISIKDEGPGISLDEQTKLFDRFSILSNKPTNNESSSGLGLFIVKELLKSIKGGVTVQSALNEGSTFTIKIPLELKN